MQNKRKFLKTVHIICMGCWLGSMCTLFFTLFFKSAMAVINIAATDQIIFRIFPWVSTVCSLSTILSGLTISMFSEWGIFWFRWITVKLLLAIVLVIITVFSFTPAINGMVAFSDTLVLFNESTQYQSFVAVSLFSSLVHISVLIFSIIVSVYKPWGRGYTKKPAKQKFRRILTVVLFLVIFVFSAMQHIMLEKIRNTKIQDIDLSVIPDGIYYGKVESGFLYECEVLIQQHQFAGIRFLKNRDSFYARLAENITYKLIGQNSLRADAVTGATTTSKLLLKSIEDALQNPGRTQH